MFSTRRSPARRGRTPNDADGHPRTVTESGGHAVTTDYDLFDRPTRYTYPDATYESFTYDRLDLVESRDRPGRTTRRTYHASRRLIGVRDPLDGTASIEWCKCGSLAALTDGKGQTTRWTRDVLARVTSEVRADGRPRPRRPMMWAAG